MPDPYEIATWRFEQIAPLIDPSLSPFDQRTAPGQVHYSHLFEGFHGRLTLPSEP